MASDGLRKEVRRRFYCFSRRVAVNDRKQDRNPRRFGFCTVARSAPGSAFSPRRDAWSATDSDSVSFPRTGPREAVPEVTHTFMQSFPDWLRSPPELPPPTVWRPLSPKPVRRGFPGSVSRRLCGLPPETLADILRSLVAGGQVIALVKVGGEMRYRAAG